MKAMIDIVTEVELKEMSGYKQRAAVMRWLERNGISYLQGKNGKISTTRAIIEAAMGLNSEPVIEFA